MQIYNKTRSDFKSDEEWNSYIEEREDIIFNLTENIDIEWTRERIWKYEMQNWQDILKNENKRWIE